MAKNPDSGRNDAVRGRPPEVERALEVIAQEDVHASAATGTQGEQVYRAIVEMSNEAALTRMHALSARLQGAAGLEPLLQEIMDVAVAIVGAERGTLQLIEADSLHIVAHHGHQRPFLQFFASAEARTSVCGEAMKRGQRVIVEDVEHSPLFVGTESLKVLLDAGVRAVQSTPLRTRQERPLGILTTQWAAPHVPDEHDLWRIDLLARQAADLIEHKQAEEALQRSEGLLRAVIETTADAIYAKDAESRLVLVNPAALKVVGKPADQILGRNDREPYDDPAVGEAILENDRQVMASGTVQAFEETLLTPKGYRFFLDKKAPWRDGHGNVIGIIGVSRDITEEKLVVEALRDRELRLRLAQEYGHIGVWDWSPDTGEENFSAEMNRIYGLEPGTIRTYQDWLSRVHPDDAERVEAQCDAALANHEPFDLEFRIFHSSGQVHWIAGRGAAEYDETGRITRVLGINIDITAIKKAEETLRELNTTLESKVAQRTAQLEYRAKQLQRLTLELTQAEEHERRRIAVILHEDLQQQIAGAKFHLNLVRNRAKDDQLRADADTVDAMLKDAIEKSRTLAHDLSPAVMHMNDLAEVLRWLANRVHAQHGLVVKVDALGNMALHSEALAMFLFRATQEMLFNVVKHARVNEAAIRVRRIGRYVCLSVSDQGRGCDPRELEETSGIGLFSIRERTELLGGRMKIKSRTGKGSRFSITVPDGPNAETSKRRMGETATSPADSPIRGWAHSSADTQRVLLVDDHDIVRQGLASLLQEAPGIELVGEAPDGREAINMAIALRPDVVIMDVSMPLMGGDQAARQIKIHLPETRVIAMSMYDEADKKEKMFEAGAEGYILKTVSADELIAAIRGKE